MADAMALDANNDIFLTDGRITRASGAAYVLQKVRSKLLFYKGEWVFDVDDGTAWNQKVFVQPVDLPTIEGELKARIIETDGVESLLTFDLNFDRLTRKLSVSFEAQTTEGIINSEVYLNV